MRPIFSFLSAITIAASSTLVGGAAFAQYRYGETEMYFAENFDRSALQAPQSPAFGSVLPNTSQPGSPGTIDSNLSASAIGDDQNFIAAQFAAKAGAYRQTWAGLPDVKVPLGAAFKAGAAGPRVAALRERLGLTPGTTFDSALSAKIIEYRKAHGLPVSAVADRTLLNSLNLGPNHYLDIIEVNLDRAKQMPSYLGDRFILVDAANQLLYMYDGQSISGSMRVVVGKPSDPTPIMAAMVSYSEVNPYWNVPPDLVRDRYAARVLRGGKNYLDTRGFEALSSWEDDARVLGYREVDWRAVQRGDFQLRLRQRPGPANGMGAIKFMMPNRLGIYLHDSPSRQLFNESHRAFSAGCVRLQYAWQLAEWVYGSREAVATKKPAAIVNLPKTLPVYINYFTAKPTEHGFEFRDDFYNRDARTKAKIDADREYQRQLEEYEAYQRELEAFNQQQQQPVVQPPPTVS